MSFSGPFSTGPAQTQRRASENSPFSSSAAHAHSQGPTPTQRHTQPLSNVQTVHDHNAQRTVKAADIDPTSSNDSVSPLQTAPTAAARHYDVRSKLGLHAHAPVIKEHADQEHHDLWWPRIRLVLREPFCEFWGVFIMIMFGDGSVAQVLLSEHLSGAPGGNGFGSYQSISWGWGIGVYLGILTAGSSGAFLNPAITLAFSVYRGLPFRRFFIYLIAQFLGGFVASGVVYANYIDAIDAYAGQGVRTVPPATTATAQIFCTYPQAFLTKTSQFFSEFITSTLLLFVIFALKDDSNKGTAVSSGNWFPLSLFFLIFGLGACFGYETGYAINLARDLGPRLMSYVVGYGPEVWSAGDYYFWVPLVGSFTGCLFGGFLYDVFIYTGPESPINSPWWGLGNVVNPVGWVRERQRMRATERMDELGLDSRAVEREKV